MFQKPWNIGKFSFDSYLKIKHPWLDDSLIEIIDVIEHGNKIYHEEEQKITTRSDFLEDSKIQTSRYNMDFRKNINYEEIDYIYKLIEFCKDLGSRVVIITPPYCKDHIELINKQDSDYFKEFHKIVEEIAKNENVEYYYYENDSRINENYNNFYDSHHLSELGASLFTSILFNDIVD